MESHSSSGESFWLYAVPLLAKQGRSSLLEVVATQGLCSWMLLYAALALIAFTVLVWSLALPGGPAWGKLRVKLTIPGPKGWPVLGSLMEMGPLAHRHLAYLARLHNAESLMALSFGSTRLIISSKPDVAREILNSSSFANRPLKQSAQQLLFGRAIGFAPQGEYWRGLRRIAANHLFSPRRIASHEAGRQLEARRMLASVREDALRNGGVIEIRPYLQRASLNNIMSTVFGRRYDFNSRFKDATAEELQGMIREGFDLLGAFNWSDHLPALRAFDPQRIHYRCAQLVPRVKAFVQTIIDEHRQCSKKDTAEFDFVDVLLSLGSEDKLDDADIIAVLWEMIFRGTDTTAILTEWVIAELILHPDIQKKAQKELDSVVGNSRPVQEADILKMPYLQAIVKESLRMHPPGPLLSWARLSTEDVTVAGHYVPKGTTAMVNMWSITHDPDIWSNPQDFTPERFMPSHGGEDIDVRGNDLRLAPFGAGRRVCPGRALGLATVQIWLARLLQHYCWLPSEEHPVDLSEVLKLSCEMASPLKSCPVERVALFVAEP